jgi:hypothetical protein
VPLVLVMVEVWVLGLLELSGTDADPGVLTLGSDPFAKSTGAGRSTK